MARPFDRADRTARVKPFCEFDMNRSPIFDWEIALPSLQGIPMRFSDGLHSWEPFPLPLIGPHASEPVDLGDLVPLPPSCPVPSMLLWEFGSPSRRSFTPASPARNRAAPPDQLADYHTDLPGIRTSCLSLIFPPLLPFTGGDASHPSLHVTSHTFRWLTRRRSTARSATISASASCFLKRCLPSSRIVSPLSYFPERRVASFAGYRSIGENRSHLSLPSTYRSSICRLLPQFRESASFFPGGVLLPSRIIGPPVSTVRICCSFIG